MGEWEKSGYCNATQWEIFEPAFSPTNPHASGNRVIRRSYVNWGDWESYQLNGPEQTGLLQNVTDPVTGRVLSSRWGQNSANDDPTEQRSGMLGMQAHYLDRRVVVGAG